jgi:diguanylate cyclase (GGDEF)-like protein/PAS domain S-box-containing protein
MRGGESDNQVALKVVDHVDALLGYWDRELRCTFANATYKVWFGRTRDEMLGTSMQDVLGPLFERNLPHIRAALAGEVQKFELQIQIADGSIRDSLACYYPDVSDGVVQGFTVHLADVTPMKKLERELAEAKAQAELLATHDFLTGLPNRVLLMDRLEEALVRAERQGMMVGVAAIDLDQFKTINDTYGHPHGDLLLKEVARRMQHALRGSDTVTRWGGDEFILLVGDIGHLDHVHAAVDRLQHAVAGPFHIGKCNLTVSCSCGIAVYPLNASTAADLLERADRALYSAKASGKNTVAFAEVIV